MRLGRWSQREDYVSSLLAMEMGKTEPRSLRDRIKEQGNLDPVTCEPGVGWSQLPRCRAWDGMKGPEEKLVRWRLRS